MTTHETSPKEFLEIVEKHLSLTDKGEIVIKDPELAKKYENYLSKYASKSKVVASSASDVNVFCFIHKAK